MSHMCVCVCCRLCPSPFSSSDHAEDSEKKNFFMLEPSEASNGCFLAVLGRVVSIRKHTTFNTSRVKHVFPFSLQKSRPCLLVFALCTF